MENSIPEGKGRLGWFDAMRGLAIILVVLGHILCFSLGLSGSILNQTIYAFHMPLFFFISGFFAYKACESWTLSRVKDTGKRRFQALIICTLIFFVLAAFCCSEVLHSQLGLLRYGSALGSLRGGFLFGYWFTIVLFQMFVVFLALSLLSKLFKSEHILEAGLILISIACLVIFRMKFLDDSLLWGVLCTKNFCKFFQFFTLGIFCRKYQELFETTLSKNWFKAGITVCAVVCLVLYFHDDFRNFNALLYGFVHDIAIRYALLLVVVSFFFTKREFFEVQNGTSSVLRYIGRRTLDIYMIHYFFFPDLSVLKDWLLPGNMFIFQLTIGLVVSALIIAVCLLLSEILRMSSFLSAWLFGVKSQEQN